VEYTDGTGVESDTFLWEVEPGTDVLSPATLPNVASTPPMDPRELDAMVRAARWAALTPSLPFSGLAEDRPPLRCTAFYVHDLSDRTGRAPARRRGCRFPAGHSPLRGDEAG
jgi:hypothetical protein